MILKNAKIFQKGKLVKGIMLIQQGIIKYISLNPLNKNYKELSDLNEDGRVIDCKNKIIIPGIIDCHTHLRDMGQKQKESFRTATKAAAFSGITTVFNMPNTIPPANTSKNVKKWMNKAKENIFIDVGFISGVPEQINQDEIKKILDLGVVGLKIYPHDPITKLDWTQKVNFQILLNISSIYQTRIFIHPQWPTSEQKNRELFEEYMFRHSSLLKLHNELYPCNSETRFVEYALKNYKEFISSSNLAPKDYPLIHFCHISCKQSYSLIKNILEANSNYKISYEVTPHHLLLSNELELSKPSIGKVMPPLRDKEHSEFLFKELCNGNLLIIGTDHAPHTIQEKSQNFFDAPSGFPGLETYPLLLLNQITKYKLSLANFVKVASVNPARLFNLKKKGLIQEGYYADILIIDKTSEYAINPKKFHTKSKISPYEGFKTNIQIWKVLLRGNEINLENDQPRGKILTYHLK
jgi:dihydroorotase